MPLPKRSQIRPGLRVQIVEKQNQRTGALTEGVVLRILTKSPSHPHGIKVMLEDGRVGRVQAIVDSTGNDHFVDDQNYPTPPFSPPVHLHHRLR
jgi:uncharacterized repeat protein (TIGR03833 family)